MKDIYEYLNTNVKANKILSCSKVKYSSIDIENGKASLYLFDNRDDLYNHLENIYDDEEFDNVLEIIDSELRNLNCMKLKHSEECYQIVSCFDKNNN